MSLPENVVAPSGKSLNVDEVALLADAFQTWQRSSDENGGISTLQEYYDRVWLADRGIVTYPKLDASDCAEGTTYTSCHMFAKYATVVDAIAAFDEVSAFAGAVKSADLDKTLRGTGPFTIFAPTNAAFAALPAGTVPAGADGLRDFLYHHMVGRELSSMSLAPGTKVTTMDETELSIGLANHSSRTIDGARFVNADIFAKNGVVHIIDKVLVRGLSTASSVRKSVPALERIQGRQTSPREMPALVPLRSGVMPALVPLRSEAMPHLVPLNEARQSSRSRPQRKVPALVPLRSKEMPRLVATSASSARRKMPDLVRLERGRKSMPELVPFSDRATTAAAAKPMPALVPIASLQDTAQATQATRRTRSAQTLRPASGLGTYVTASALPRAEDLATTGTPTLTVASVRFAVRELRRSFLTAKACDGACSVDAFVSELHSAAVALCSKRTPRAFALLDADRMEVVAEDSEQSDRFVACAGIVTAALRDNEGSPAVRQVIATEMGSPDNTALVGIQRPVAFIANMSQAWARLVVEAAKGAPIPSTASTEYASAVHVFDGAVNKLLTFRTKLDDSQIGTRLEFLAEAAYAIMISIPVEWFRDGTNVLRVELIRDKLGPMRSEGNGTSESSAMIGRSLLTATTLEGKLAIGFKNIIRDSLALRGKAAFDNMYLQVNAFVVAAMKKRRPSGAVDDENKQAEFLSFAAGAYLMERVHRADLARDRRAEGRVNVNVDAIFRDRVDQAPSM